MKITDAVSGLFNVGSAKVAGVQQDLEEAKQTAVTAYAISTGLQLIQTIAIVYIAVQVSKRKG